MSSLWEKLYLSVASYGRGISKTKREEIRCHEYVVASQQRKRKRRGRRKNPSPWRQETDLLAFWLRYLRSQVLRRRPPNAYLFTRPSRGAGDIFTGTGVEQIYVEQGDRQGAGYLYPS